MIEILDLKKSYGELEILKGINIKISKGEIHGLIGTSGAGKSTLLGCMNGLESYHEGSVRIDGKAIESLKELEVRELRKNMGMIFQGFSLISRKSVYKNIAIPMECWGASKSEIDRKVKSLAKLVGLEDKLKARPSELSGGQKQRVAIARALTLDPEYLLCDECTSALDPKTTISILKLLEDIRDTMGITIVIVTHEMGVIQKLCDRVSILENGTLIETGTVSEIFMKNSGALKSLLGESHEKSILERAGVRIMAEFSEDNKYLLWSISNEIQGKYSLIESKTYYFQSKKYFSFTIELDSRDIDIVANYLRENNIEHEILNEGEPIC